ncbi:hypothetical protein [Solidesulfovibrio sp.]
MNWISYFAKRLTVLVFVLFAFFLSISSAFCADDATNKALEELDKALGSQEKNAQPPAEVPRPSAKAPQATAPAKPAKTPQAAERSFSGSEKILFKLQSDAAVINMPSQDTVFRITTPTKITKIWTYHYNQGKGAEPGTIGLRDVNSGQVLGEWPAIGTQRMLDPTPGAKWPTSSDGPPFLYWAVTPRIVLNPGKYEVLDADAATWSQNAEMGGRGCAWVYGTPAD